MSLNSVKYKFIQKLLKVKEEDVLRELKSILNEKAPEFIWDELSPEVKKGLDGSIEQRLKGQAKRHDDVSLHLKNRDIA